MELKYDYSMYRCSIVNNLKDGIIYQNVSYF